MELANKLARLILGELVENRKLGRGHSYKRCDSMATKCSYYSPRAFFSLQGHAGDENSRKNLPHFVCRGLGNGTSTVKLRRTVLKNKLHIICHVFFPFIICFDYILLLHNMYNMYKIFLIQTTSHSKRVFMWAFPYCSRFKNLYNHQK